MTTAAAAAAAAAAHVQLNHRNVSQRAVYLDYSCEQKDSGGKKIRLASLHSMSKQEWKR